MCSLTGEEQHYSKIIKISDAVMQIKDLVKGLMSVNIGSRVGMLTFLSMPRLVKQYIFCCHIGSIQTFKLLHMMSECFIDHLLLWFILLSPLLVIAREVLEWSKETYASYILLAIASFTWLSKARQSLSRHKSDSARRSYPDVHDYCQNCTMSLNYLFSIGEERAGERVCEFRATSSLYKYNFIGPGKGDIHIERDHQC